MKALSVIELAKLYGMNRQSIYKRINKGDLSKNSDGKIDFSEAIRVFGEPSQRTNQNVTLQSEATQNATELDRMRQQVEMLQKQLELAQERENFQREQLQAKDNQIYSLQLILGAPKEHLDLEKVKESNQELTDKLVEEKTIPLSRNDIKIPNKRLRFLEKIVRAKRWIRKFEQHL